MVTKGLEMPSPNLPLLTLWPWSNHLASQKFRWVWWIEPRKDADSPHGAGFLPLLFTLFPVCKSERPLQIWNIVWVWEVGDLWVEGFDHPEHLLSWERGSWVFEDTMYYSSLTADPFLAILNFYPSASRAFYVSVNLKDGFISQSPLPARNCISTIWHPLRVSPCHDAEPPMPHSPFRRTLCIYLLYRIEKNTRPQWWVPNSFLFSLLCDVSQFV